MIDIKTPHFNAARRAANTTRKPTKLTNGSHGALSIFRHHADI